MKRTSSYLLLSIVSVGLIFAALPALAQSLGTAGAFAVLGGSTVTNTGPTIVTGNLGVSPGAAVTGFPPGLVVGGTIHAADAVALQAQNDTTTAYNALAGLGCDLDLSGQDLGGMTLVPGVYCFAASAQLTGTLLLDAQGDPNAVFVFQIGSTLTTATNAVVDVINGGDDCHAYWQVGSSATLGTGTLFAGNILALTSITLNTGANVSGRVLARNGAVTLDTNSVAFCALAVANPGVGPATLDNYESCDITTGHGAATLLLPYFEVDPSGAGDNTLVTITNISDTAIVAHFTVWTDWSFPVLDFNIFLTGYDVAGISLRDVFLSGNLPSTGDFGRSPIGRRSGFDLDFDGVRETNHTAPYFIGAGCGSNQGGNGAIPGFLREQVASALTGGPYAAGGTPCEQVGSISDNLIGYITIDTAISCTQSLPIDAAYFQAPEILWENLLMGDYIRLNDAEGVAGGNPLVHLAALPGGDAAPVTTLPNTFYERYQQFSPLGDTTDRRQPLPALFAARYIEAGTAFDTDFVIWREGYTDEVETADCNGDLLGLYPFNNSRILFTETVRFDERENPTVRGGCTVSPCPPSDLLAETQLENINGGFFPSDPSSDTGGWIYMNLTQPATDPIGTYLAYGRPSYNWVQIRMTGAGLYGVDFDAAYIMNGCGGIVGVTGNNVNSANKIGPKWDRGDQEWSGN